MRSGCYGCLVAWVGLIVGALLLAAAVGVSVRVLAFTEGGEPVASTEDGKRALQKLFGLARAGRGVETVTLTEAEVNALLARHVVDAGGSRLGGLNARLVGGDRLELRARIPLGRVLSEIGLGALAGVLPARWQARPVRLHVGARLRVAETTPRQLRMDVDEFAMGRLWLPALALRLVVDPAVLSLLHWRLPDRVERVEIEPGRVVIRTAS